MRVFSNSAMSADGKIGTAARDHIAIGSIEDLRRMSRIRALADAVLVGGATFRSWPLPLVENPAHLLGEAPVRTRPMVNAVLTRQGVCGAAGRFPDPRVDLLVLGPPELDVDAHRSSLGAEVITHPEPGVRWALDLLAARGCRSVLIEGGGDLLFRALDEGVLQELYLTVCPLLIGGSSSPSPADGRGFSAHSLRRLELRDLERVGDELFLHYNVSVGDRGQSGKAGHGPTQEQS